MDLIFHIASRSEWETAVVAGQPYTPDSIENDGFIHCSTKEQVLGPANVLFHSQTGLVLLCIDAARLQAEIVYEDCYQIGYQFPHIYGPLNLDAVACVVDFPPNPDGSFSLPVELRDM